MKPIHQTLFAGIFLIVGMFHSPSASALPACSFGHCTSFDSAVKKICANKYRIPESQMNASHTVNVYDSNGAECTCPCSCVAAETLIQLFEGEEILARTVRKDDTVLLPQASYRDGNVFGANGSPIEKGEVQQILLDTNKILTVSPNHTFVGMNGKLITAEKVEKGNQIMGADGKPVHVIQSRRMKNFTGTLHNFIVNEKSDKPKDHLLVTNGVQSGDWLLQSTQDTMRQEIDLRLGRVQTLSEIVD